MEPFAINRGQDGFVIYHPLAEILEAAIRGRSALVIEEW